VQVLHVSGRGKQVAAPAGGATPYVVVAYVDRMDLAYAACDAVLCRAGAGTVCELSALGIPAAYVPLPIGNGEQRRNAEPLVAAGGGLLVADADLSPAWVRGTLLPVLADPDRLAAVAVAARAHGVLDAADRLADLVVRAATGGDP
jgi:UDP-N-acetylglucosamine--N-acetylmuramyl-(pentapeptide) pyrophosphoryl-undecaprenol N-acetylglucosamine transferase